MLRLLRSLALLRIQIALLANPVSVSLVLVLAVQEAFISFRLLSTLQRQLVVFFLALRVQD